MVSISSCIWTLVNLAIKDLYSEVLSDSQIQQNYS